MLANRPVSRLLAACLAGGLAFAFVAGVAVTGQTGAEIGKDEWAEKVPLAPESLLVDVADADGALVVVGERGHILVSRDRGASWAQADVPSRALLTGVFMHDAQLGWAVGHDEVVLRTRDGGSTWERVHYAPEHEKPLLDVWFADASRGLAIGAYGELFATSDGGDTWEPRPINDGDDFHLNQIARAGDGALYVAAEAGHLYRSDDGGETWQPLTSPYQGSFFGLLPRDDGSVLAFGLRGHLYRSRDRGLTWEPIETGTEETLTSGIGLGGGRYAISGMAGTLLWGDDASSTVRLQELSNRRAIVATARADDQHLLLFGEGGVQRIEIPR